MPYSRRIPIATVLVAAGIVAGSPARAALWCAASADGGKPSYVSQVVPSKTSVDAAAAAFKAYVREHFPFAILSETDIVSNCLENTSRDRAAKSRNDWIAAQAKRGINPIVVHWFRGL